MRTYSVIGSPAHIASDWTQFKLSRVIPSVIYVYIETALKVLKTLVSSIDVANVLLIS